MHGGHKESDRTERPSTYIGYRLDGSVDKVKGPRDGAARGLGKW